LSREKIVIAVRIDSNRQGVKSWFIEGVDNQFVAKWLFFCRIFSAGARPMGCVSVFHEVSQHFSSCFFSLAIGIEAEVPLATGIISAKHRPTA